MSVGWLGKRTSDFRRTPTLKPNFVIYPEASGLLALSAKNVSLVVETADGSKRYDIGRKARL